MTESITKRGALLRLLDRRVMFFKEKDKPLWSPETQAMIDENKRLSEQLGRTLKRMRNKRQGITIDHDHET
jgi:hypothetical protein